MSPGNQGVFQLLKEVTYISNSIIVNFLGLTFLDFTLLNLVFLLPEFALSEMGAKLGVGETSFQWAFASPYFSSASFSIGQLASAAQSPKLR
jgi:hypothetical protein